MLIFTRKRCKWKSNIVKKNNYKLEILSKIMSQQKKAFTFNVKNLKRRLDTNVKKEFLTWLPPDKSFFVLLFSFKKYLFFNYKKITSRKHFQALKNTNIQKQVKTSKMERKITFHFVKNSLERERKKGANHYLQRHFNNEASSCQKKDKRSGSRKMKHVRKQNKKKFLNKKLLHDFFSTKKFLMNNKQFFCKKKQQFFDREHKTKSPQHIHTNTQATNKEKRQRDHCQLQQQLILEKKRRKSGRHDKQ
ncbi:hypothetical protein RFI_25272 [Reticulomyxa filosa]|uniref:Uncharacterized protein n=1 Tax=Reticulomyxa filosa TaxID=46433 RepID=X6MDY6_RETFI|nr:hypothetical protein RFI_25272 [Reticulomyxa filosa]|eukprot:ETO12104.1 hypothetical protein RFI_25272 [Reticulomyxa filosa]